MPQIDKHPIATRMRERAMFDETQLQALLHAWRYMLNKNLYGAAEFVEKAIYAFRREELEHFAYELEQHEFERNKAPSPSED